MKAAKSFEETDLERWAAKLEEFSVMYAVVGGGAAQLHGAKRPTMDIDVVPQWEHENLERLSDMLRSIDAESRSGPKVAGDTITPEILIDREITNWTTALGDIDILVGIPGPEGEPVVFDDLYSRATFVEIGTPAIIVTVASLDDIIVSKEFASRAKDGRALPELRELRAKAAMKADDERES